MNGYTGLVALMAFDHIPVGLSAFSGAATAAAALGNISTFSDYPFGVDQSTAFAVTGENINNGTISDSEGVWAVTNGSATSPINQSGSFSGRAFTYPILGGAIDWTKPRVMIGMRVKSASQVTSTTQSLVYLKASSSIPTLYDSRPCLSTTNAAFSYGMVVGTSAYFEFLFDILNNQITIWKNGTQVDQYTPATALSLLPSTGVLTIGGTGTPTSGWSFQFKDMYIQNDLGDGTFARVGALKGIRTPTKNVVGVGWSASDAGSGGTLQSDLNTLTSTTGALSVPTTITPAIPTPLTAAIDTTGLTATSGVKAISVHMSGYRDPGAQLQYAAELDDAVGNVIPLASKSYLLAKTVSPNRTILPALTTNVDGSVLSVAGIAAMTVKITPSQLSLAG